MKEETVDIAVSDVLSARKVSGDMIETGDASIAIGGWIGSKDRKDVKVGEGSVAITSIGDAKTPRYSIALVGDSGTASSGPSGASIVRGDGCAHSADGSVAYVIGWQGYATAGNGAIAACHHDGIAGAGVQSIAATNSFAAIVGSGGIASVRKRGGHAEAGENGIAICWNDVSDGNVRRPLDCTKNDPAFQDAASRVQADTLRAGNGGLLITVYKDSKGQPQFVIGAVGSGDIRFQSGLEANRPYRLSDDGVLQPVAE